METDIVYSEKTLDEKLKSIVSHECKKLVEILKLGLLAWKMKVSFLIKIMGTLTLQEVYKISVNAGVFLV